MLRPSPIFTRLDRGEEVYGLLNSVPSPLLCEMIGYAGYHFVILDMEHLLRGGDELMHCLRACESAGCSTPAPRPSSCRGSKAPPGSTR